MSPFSKEMQAVAEYCRILQQTFMIVCYFNYSGLIQKVCYKSTSLQYFPGCFLAAWILGKGKKNTRSRLAGEPALFLQTDRAGARLKGVVLGGDTITALHDTHCNDANYDHRKSSLHFCSVSISGREQTKVWWWQQNFSSCMCLEQISACIFGLHTAFL